MLPMLVVVPGMAAEARLLHRAKAFCPMLWHPAMVMETRL